MTLTKVINGKRVEMTAQEEQDWLANQPSAEELKQSQIQEITSRYESIISDTVIVFKTKNVRLRRALPLMYSEPNSYPYTLSPACIDYDFAVNELVLSNATDYNNLISEINSKIEEINQLEKEELAQL